MPLGLVAYSLDANICKYTCTHTHIYIYMYTFMYLKHGSCGFGVMVPHLNRTNDFVLFLGEGDPEPGAKTVWKRGCPMLGNTVSAPGHELRG